MFLFKRKKIEEPSSKNAEKNKQDAEIINFNSKSVETLIVLCKSCKLTTSDKAEPVLLSSEEFCAKLEKLKNELQFLTPSIKELVYELDAKISRKIEDFKYVLGEETVFIEKVEKLLRDIKVLIAERNANL